MFKRKATSTAVLIVMGAMAALPAVAQDKLERVEVTGSSIKRVSTEGALPVQTFSRQDIQRSGVTTVTDFIQQLPVMQGFSVAADSVGGGGGGVTTASIHDVGEQYTLVLLNGRRVAPASSGTTIDLNSIPLAAIERIEVLTDGASALYGSDAIAGVVNFILKKGEAPFQFDARYSTPQGKGGRGFNMSASKGIGDLDRDGFSLFASVSYDQQSQLKAADRSFAKTGIIKFRDQKGRDLTFFNGSSRSIPPNVDVFYTEFDPEAGKDVSTSVSFSPYLQAGGKCPSAHVIGGRQCIFDYTSSVEIQPEQERTSLFTSGEVKLGSTGFKAFGNLAMTNAHIKARIAPYPAEFGLNRNSPLFAKYVQPYLTAAQLANLDDDGGKLDAANVKYRLYDMGNRAYDYQTKANHLVAGVDGQLFSWDVNAAVTHSTQKQVQGYLGGFPLADKFNAAVASGKIDPFPYTLGTMPAEMLKALNETGYVGTYNTTDIKMTGVDARASRELFAMGGGNAALALGADFRKTSYAVVADKRVANAEILFDDPQPEYDVSRKNAGAFAEIALPVTKQLELSGAARYDTVSGVTDSKNNKDFGQRDSAATYKLSFRFTPVKNILTRGSYGTGFRTASMLQIAQPLADFGVTGGSYACPFTSKYDPLGYFAKGYICDDKQKEAFKGGNANLKPEKSKQWTVGFVYDISDHVSMSADLWSVQIDQAVQEVSEALILEEASKYLDLYTTKTKLSNGRTYVAIKLMPINIGKTDNQGLDWSFTFRNRTPIGRITSKVAGTYLIKSKYTKPGTSDQWVTSLGQFGVNDKVSFRNVITASTSVDSGAWSHTMSMNYRSGYKDKAHSVASCAVEDADGCTSVQLDVPQYYTFDWQTRWAINANLSLVGGIMNLLNDAPPLSLRNTGSHQLGYDPRYASPMGRTFYVSGSYKF